VSPSWLESETPGWSILSKNRVPRLSSAQGQAKPQMGLLRGYRAGQNPKTVQRTSIVPGPGSPGQSRKRRSFATPAPNSLRHPGIIAGLRSKLAKEIARRGDAPPKRHRLQENRRPPLRSTLKPGTTLRTAMGDETLEDRRRTRDLRAPERDRLRNCQESQWRSPPTYQGSTSARQIRVPARPRKGRRGWCWSQAGLLPSRLAA